MRSVIPAVTFPVTFPSAGTDKENGGRTPPDWRITEDAMNPNPGDQGYAPVLDVDATRYADPYEEDPYDPDPYARL